MRYVLNSRCPVGRKSVALRSLASSAAMVILAFAISSCNYETVTQPVLEPPDETLGTLEIVPRVSIIAVGTTLQLTTLARSLTGAPMVADSVQFVLQSLADTLRVQLTRDGKVTGLSLTSGPMHVAVNAFAYRGNAVTGQRALVQVTPTVVPGTVLSIQPVPPDSSRLALGSTKNIVARLRNPETGASVSSPIVWPSVRPEDHQKILRHQPSLATPRGQRVQFQPSPNPAPNQIRASSGEGQVWVYSRVNVYGTDLVDSVQYTLTYPYTLTVQVEKLNLLVTSFTAGNQVHTIAPGGTVTFRNGVAATDPLLIAFDFDDPAAATAATPAATLGGTTGNVAPLRGTQSSTRRFLTPGIYHWTALASEGPAPWPGQTVTGTIVVK